MRLGKFGGFVNIGVHKFRLIVEFQDCCAEMFREGGYKVRKMFLKRSCISGVLFYNSSS